MEPESEKKNVPPESDAPTPASQNIEGITPQNSEPAPAEPTPAEPAAETPVEPATGEPEGITPPKPGQVIDAGSEPAASAGPRPTEPQPVRARGGDGGKGWLKWLIILVVITALAAGAWWAYQKYYKKAPSQTVSQSKDIPLLKIGILTADYGNLYPDMSTGEYGYLTNSQMFEGLVRYENKSSIAPDLATNWKNPDNKTWVFTIKSGVKFHDGHTLAASDVKYSIDKVIASKSDLAETFADTIASVDVVGSNQVKITTTDPDPTLLNKLTFLYVIDANLPKGDEPSQAGTGPYRIKPGTKPSGTEVQMVAFDGYHGGRPATRALSFGSQDTVDALIKAYKSHTYNIIGSIDPDKAKTVTGAKQFVSSEPDVDFIGFNTLQAGPLQKKQVREAIRYAVNPLDIGKARGYQVTPISQMIPPSIPGYNPAITPYKQDVAKAKQLLTQAGYPNGLTLKLSSAGSPTVAAEIAKELKPVGITVNVDQHQDFNEFIDYFTGGKAEMFTIDYASDTLDGLDIYQSTIMDVYYKNTKFTDLLTQAGTTVDPARRLKVLQDAAVIIDQDIPVVPLSSGDNLWLMDKPYVLNQDLPSAYVSAYFYKVHQ